MLADNTKTFQEIDSDVTQHPANQEALQSRIDRIAQWAQDWQMKINPFKSKIMHIGRNNPGLHYVINGTQIESVATEKDLGFHQAHPRNRKYWKESSEKQQRWCSA